MAEPQGRSSCPQGLSLTGILFSTCKKWGFCSLEHISLNWVQSPISNRQSFDQECSVETDHSLYTGEKHQVWGRSNETFLTCLKLSCSSEDSRMRGTWSLLADCSRFDLEYSCGHQWCIRQYLQQRIGCTLFYFHVSFRTEMTVHCIRQPHYSLHLSFYVLSWTGRAKMNTKEYHSVAGGRINGSVFNNNFQGHVCQGVTEHSVCYCHKSILVPKPQLIMHLILRTKHSL